MRRLGWGVFAAGCAWVLLAACGDDAQSAGQGDGGGAGEGAGDAGRSRGDAGPATVARCSDGEMNGDEADIDCGGSCPDGCADGATCDRDADCTSGHCHAESLLCELPHCGDGLRNQGESDVDCGGPCPDGCFGGQQCASDDDCGSGRCDDDGTCAQASCDDGLRNQDESDVDCGGSCEDSCADGETCEGDGDCASGFCDVDGAGQCAMPSCSDGARNQDETDVDCGGSCGASCADGASCDADGDCESGVCLSPSQLCAPPACSNGVLDDDETDEDCGGACGASCEGGQDCGGDGDCTSGFCDPSLDQCATPSCEDGFLNQDETDEDCGNGCGATCEQDQACDSPSGDCADGLVCEGGTCQPSCGPALAPMDDGSSAARQALLISELDPGDHIELYNASGSAIALGSSDYQLCSPFSYSALSTLGASVTIPAGGFATLSWPGAFSDTDAGGEVILYLDGSFGTDSSIMDFVCWGTNPHGSRKAQAEATGKWSGACAGALTNGAIHREASTTGTAAADYDVTLAPQPQTCTP